MTEWTAAMKMARQKKMTARIKNGGENRRMAWQPRYGNYFSGAYSSSQNKVPIAERLFSDFTAKSFRKFASIIAQPEKF